MHTQLTLPPPLPDNGPLKRCGRCHQELPHRAFSPSQIRRGGAWCRTCNSARNRAVRQGTDWPLLLRITDVCEWCGSDIRHRRAHARFCSTSCNMKGWRRNNPGRHREHLIKSVYGLTPADWDALLATQGGVCPICHTIPVGQWNVDHSHTTGAVRGILCSGCNLGLGNFHDDPQLLRSALAYLEAHPDNS